MKNLFPILGAVSTTLTTSYASLLTDAPRPNERFSIGDMLALRAVGHGDPAGGGDVSFRFSFGNLGVFAEQAVPAAEWGTGNWVLDLSVMVQLKDGQAYDPRNSPSISLKAVGSLVTPGNTVYSLGSAAVDTDLAALAATSDLNWYRLVGKSTVAGDKIIVDGFSANVIRA